MYRYARILRFSLGKNNINNLNERLKKKSIYYFYIFIHSSLKKFFNNNNVHTDTYELSLRIFNIDICTVYIYNNIYICNIFTQVNLI